VVYLVRARRPVLAFAVPMLVVVVATTGAMILNLLTWLTAYGAPGSPPALTIGLAAVILGLEIWMIVESGLILRTSWRERAGPATSPTA
jgi:hypothetical protein